MIYRDTQDLIDAIKPYCSLDTLSISTENRDWRGKLYRSDLVWILEKYFVGFEVFDNEIRVQYFEDHVHLEQWTEEDKTSHVREAKELLIKLFTYPIVKREVFKGKRRIKYEYFFINDEGERERVNGPWFIGLFGLSLRKETVREKVFKYSLANHDFEPFNPSLNIDDQEQG